MTQEAYAIWHPEYNGHAPPNWRGGMKWTDISGARVFDSDGFPEWKTRRIYYVEPEALTAPNEDAVADGWAISGALSIIRAMSPDELAKHGITLAPEKDWAVELVEELDGYDRNAWPRIIRERVVLKGEG